MFVQIIEGKVKDADLVKRQGEAWSEKLKPGAVGFLGSTSGIADDGRFVTVARFESADAASQNSQRPEQDAWWQGISAGFDGDVTFIESSDVDTFLGGGSNDAGFVQVMKGTATDKQKLREMGDQMESTMKEIRPDVMGGLVAWHGDRDFIQIVYFTSEAEARKNEGAEAEAGGSGDGDSGPDDWSALIDGEMTFIDLRDPMYD